MVGFGGVKLKLLARTGYLNLPEDQKNLADKTHTHTDTPHMHRYKHTHTDTHTHRDRYTDRYRKKEQPPTFDDSVAGEGDAEVATKIVSPIAVLLAVNERRAFPNGHALNVKHAVLGAAGIALSHRVYSRQHCGGGGKDEDGYASMNTDTQTPNTHKHTHTHTHTQTHTHTKGRSGRVS